MHAPRAALALAAAATAVVLSTCAEGNPTPTEPGPRPAVTAGTPAVLINEVMADPSAASDENGEWIEVHNAGSSAVDLRGWTIRSNNDAAHTIATSVPVPAGGYVVLARNGTRSKNGGVTANYVYGNALTLANASDWITLRDPSGATVDSVAWSSSMPTGATRGVRSPAEDNADVNGPNWQTATSPYGKGDRGTPGKANDGYIPPPAEVASVTVSPSSASVVPGGEQVFTATARDANGNVVKVSFTWTTSDPAVATVDAAGVATGVAEGTATIRAAAPNGVAGQATLTVSRAGAELVVQFLDVGQGDAAYIANGSSRVFIDGGPDTAAFRAHLDALGVRNTTVDFVILSHAHFDHYSGLRELFKTARGIRIRYLFENQDAGSATTLAELRDSIRARAARGELTLRDTDDPCGTGAPSCTFVLNGGARLHILRPDPNGSTPNDRSAAVKLVGPDSASFTMWFAGDAEREEIGWFDAGADYDVAPRMDVDVLKADHHGSCNGITGAYLDRLTPAWVVVGVGADNTYGHIHTQTKDLLRSRGIPWYRTDQNGTITIRAPAVPGGGYTIAPTRGSASRDGPSDRTSSQTVCQTM